MGLIGLLGIEKATNGLDCGIDTLRHSFLSLAKSFGTVLGIIKPSGKLGPIVGKRVRRRLDLIDTNILRKPTVHRRLESIDG